MIQSINQSIDWAIDISHLYEFNMQYNTALSRGVRSLFGPTRKSSPWGNFSDSEWNQSIKHRLFIVNLLQSQIRTTGSVSTGAGLKWPNTTGQWSTFSKINTDVPKIWARPLTTGQRSALNVNLLSGRAALRRADDNLRSVNCTRYFLVATANRQFRGIHGDQIGDEGLFVSNNLADGVRQGTGPALRTDRDPVAAVVHRQTAGVLGTHRHAGGDVTVRDHAQARFLVLAVRAVGLAVAGLVFGDALLRFDAIILRCGAISCEKKVILPRPLQK